MCKLEKREEKEKRRNGQNPMDMDMVFMVIMDILVVTEL